MRKELANIVYISFFLLIQNVSFGQSQPQPPKGMPNKDTMMARSVRMMEHNLSLNQSQSSSVLDARKKQQKALDSLNAKKSLTPEQRGKELKQIQKDFKEQLKKTLTKEQFDLYKGEEKKRRDTLMERAKTKKMNIKELDTN